MNLMNQANHNQVTISASQVTVERSTVFARKVSLDESINPTFETYDDWSIETSRCYGVSWFDGMNGKWLPALVKCNSHSKCK